MDGNGRWAVRRGMPRAMGHRSGVEAMRAIIRESSDLGVQALTFYAFSTENWTRSKDEVGVLMGLLLEYFAKELEELHENRVRVRILGDLDGLPAPQAEACRKAMERTRDNAGLQLNLAINYGGRAELVRAARQLALEAREGKLLPEQIDEQAVSDRLYTAGLPDVDLLIRTSGEQRLSNFLPFQSTYAEMMMVETLWPDFSVEQYRQALQTFGKRERRFGGRPGDRP